MSWKTLLAKLRAMFHKETKEEENAELIFHFGKVSILEWYRGHINGESEVLMVPIKCDLRRATLSDALTEAVSVGHGKAVVSHLGQVDIKNFCANSNFALKDDCIGIGLLQEERGRMIFMPKCDIFCFHSNELNIFPLSIPKNKRLAPIMKIPIKTE